MAAATGSSSGTGAGAGAGSNPTPTPPPAASKRAYDAAFEEASPGNAPVKYQRTATCFVSAGIEDVFMHHIFDLLSARDGAMFAASSRSAYALYQRYDRVCPRELLYLIITGAGAVRTTARVDRFLSQPTTRCSGAWAVMQACVLFTADFSATVAIAEKIWASQTCDFLTDLGTHDKFEDRWNKDGVLAEDTAGSLSDCAQFDGELRLIWDTLSEYRDRSKMQSMKRIWSTVMFSGIRKTQSLQPILIQAAVDRGVFYTPITTGAIEFLQHRNLLSANREHDVASYIFNRMKRIPEVREELKVLHKLLSSPHVMPHGGAGIAEGFMWKYKISQMFTECLGYPCGVEIIGLLDDLGMLQLCKSSADDLVEVLGSCKILPECLHAWVSALVQRNVLHEDKLEVYMSVIDNADIEHITALVDANLMIDNNIVHAILKIRRPEFTKAHCELGKAMARQVPALVSSGAIGTIFSALLRYLVYDTQIHVPSLLLIMVFMVHAFRHSPCLVRTTETSIQKAMSDMMFATLRAFSLRGTAPMAVNWPKWFSKLEDMQTLRVSISIHTETTDYEINDQWLGLFLRNIYQTTRPMATLEEALVIPLIRNRLRAGIFLSDNTYTSTTMTRFMSRGEHVGLLICIFYYFLLGDTRGNPTKETMLRLIWRINRLAHIEHMLTTRRQFSASGGHYMLAAMKLIDDQLSGAQTFPCFDRLFDQLRDISEARDKASSTPMDTINYIPTMAMRLVRTYGTSPDEFMDAPDYLICKYDGDIMLVLRSDTEERLVNNAISYFISSDLLFDKDTLHTVTDYCKKKAVHHTITLQCLHNPATASALPLILPRHESVHLAHLLRGSHSFTTLLYH